MYSTVADTSFHLSGCCLPDLLSIKALIQALLSIKVLIQAGGRFWTNHRQPAQFPKIQRRTI